MDFESVEADFVRAFLSEPETIDQVHGLTGVHIAVSPTEMDVDDDNDVLEEEPSLFNKQPSNLSANVEATSGVQALRNLYGEFEKYSSVNCPEAMELPPVGRCSYNAPEIHSFQQCLNVLAQVHAQWGNSNPVPAHLAGSLVFPERSLSLVGFSFLGQSAYCHTTQYMKLLLFQHLWNLDPKNEARTTPAVYHIMSHWDSMSSQKPSKKQEFDGVVLGKTILRFYVTLFAGLDLEARLFYTLLPIPPKTSMDLRPIPIATQRLWFFVDIPGAPASMKYVRAARKHGAHSRAGPTELVHIQDRAVVLNSEHTMDDDYCNYDSTEGLITIHANGTRTYPPSIAFDSKWQSYTYLDTSAWNSLLSTVCDLHPGLEFLANAGDFKRKYAQTVIARIYYSWSRRPQRMMLVNLRNSDIVDSLHTLWSSDDVNRAKDYFSYEHFYVLYCHFWELDSDHDLLLSPNDLMLYDDNALCNDIIPRIADPQMLNTEEGETMLTYEDFVSFLISETDKGTAAAHRYWLKRLDLDNDGMVGSADITRQLQGQAQKVHSAGGEHVGVEDLACQIWDILHPPQAKHTCSTCHVTTIDPLGGPSTGIITTAMLAQCKLSPTILDLLFNQSKFVQGEAKDASRLRNQHGPKITEWQRWAAQAYYQLAGADSDNRE